MTLYVSYTKWTKKTSKNLRFVIIIVTLKEQIVFENARSECLAELKEQDGITITLPRSTIIIDNDWRIIHFII